MPHQPRVRVARVYDPPQSDGATRVLVDRIWPRGLSRSDAAVDEWCKVVAPSTALRKWYAHEPARFEEFSRRYQAELQSPEQTAALAHLREMAERGTLTLLTATRAVDISQAAVLAELIAPRQTRTLGGSEERAMNRGTGPLTAAGVSIWLDDLSRERLTSGSLAALVAHDDVVGVTTNPTIFAKAIAHGDVYEPQIRDLAARGVDVGEATRALTTYDVRWACDILRGVYEASGGQDGRVSIEVDPRLAHDTRATIAEARALWWAVDRPNLFIKIPAVLQGLPAITACLAEGISINVTLIFSLNRYDQVMTAFLEGMEAAQLSGRDLSVMASVASFFLSRVDTEVDKRLDEAHTEEARLHRGRVATASARLAYQHYERMMETPRWRALAALGAHPQRPLWASTSTKDPTFPDTKYVVDLVAPGVVNTMTENTLRAVAVHGEVPRDSIRGHYEEAQAVLDRLPSLGVDYNGVVQGLENRAVALFDQSWSQLGAQLSERLARRNAA